MINFRVKLNLKIGEVPLTEVIRGVDTQVRFNWIMLGWEPRSTQELMMVHTSIMARSASLNARA